MTHGTVRDLQARVDVERKTLMAAATMEKRLQILETRLDSLQRQIEERQIAVPPTVRRGWKAIVGTFVDDPLYDEAMRLGREWRENQYDETEPKQ